MARVTKRDEEVLLTIMGQISTDFDRLKSVETRLEVERGSDVIWDELKEVSRRLELKLGDLLRRLVSRVHMDSLDCLIVRHGPERYAIPMDDVFYMKEVKRADFEGTGTVHVRGEEVETVHAERLLAIPWRDRSPGAREFLVVVEADGRRVGVLFDHFLGRERLVVKPLGSYLPPVKGIAGAATAADGRLVLVTGLRRLVQNKDRETSPA